MRQRAPSASARPDSNLEKEISSKVQFFLIVKKAELFLDKVLDLQLPQSTVAGILDTKVGTELQIKVKLDDKLEPVWNEGWGQV